MNEYAPKNGIKNKPVAIMFHRYRSENDETLQEWASRCYNITEVFEWVTRDIQW